MIRNVCIICVLCGVAEYLCPDGIMKTVMRIVCAGAVIVTVISGIAGNNSLSYAVDMAKYRQLQDEILDSAEDKRKELDRLVIASECEAYIMDKAEQCGGLVTSVKVQLEWNRDGLWIPCSLIGAAADSDSARIASDIALAELGIPFDKQEWSIDGENN